MSTKPIFVATHPRACSTAFERVFMTRRDSIQCFHEPFGDAFYYGPERLSPRFADDEKTRLESGFSQSTYKTILDRIEREASEGKRVFIKDIIYYLFPTEQKPASIAPSLLKVKRGVGTESNGVNANGHVNGVNGHSNGVNGVNGHVNGVNGHSNGVNGVNGHTNGHTNGVNGTTNGHTNGITPYPFSTAPEPDNPTVMPKSLMDQFHFVFLIRDPHRSIPSYYRCTIPPLDEVTGFYEYYPSEAGYDEVRRTFEYMRHAQMVGPRLATREDEVVDEVDGIFKPVSAAKSINAAYDSGVDICVVDADEMLQKPGPMMEAFCKSVGIEYGSDLLNWDTEEDHRYAVETFEKWRGFHNDVIDSRGLNPKEPHTKSEEEYDAEWKKKYGDEAAALIRRTVDENMADYLYLKQFTMKV